MESDPSVSRNSDGDADQIPFAADSAEEENIRKLSLDNPADRADTKDLTEIVEEIVSGSEDILGESSRVALLWREGSDREREELPSPSSSGYAGERGSSVGSSGNEEIEDAENGFTGRGNSVDSVAWDTGKKHLGEVNPLYFMLFRE